MLCRAVLCRATIYESLCLLHWLEESGIHTRGICGLSMGGVHAGTVPFAGTRRLMGLGTASCINLGAFDGSALQRGFRVAAWVMLVLA